MGKARARRVFKRKKNTHQVKQNNLSLSGQGTLWFSSDVFPAPVT
jgi:hypothetical protein